MFTLHHWADEVPNAANQSRRTLQAQTMSCSEVGSDGCGQQADLLQSEKDQEKTYHYAPYPTWPWPNVTKHHMVIGNENLPDSSFKGLQEDKQSLEEECLERQARLHK